MDIAKVDQRTVQDIKAVVGVDVSDFTGHSLSGNALEHIDQRHGQKGEADHSMADLNDVARMGYVLEHYDSVEQLLDKQGKPVLSGEYFNADGSRAPEVRFQKRVDGTYYVVEAVPDAATREFRVVSAYMQKGSDSTGQELTYHKSDPQPTSKTHLDAHTTASMNRVAQTPGGVNRREVARRQKMVWEAAETGLGENGSKALRYVYNETLAAQVEPEDAYRDFRRVYTATLQGEKMEDGGIPETIRMAAEDSARQDLKAAMAEAGEESQTFGKPAAEEADLVEPGLAYEDAATAEYLKRMDTREVERLDRVTRALGARVRVVDSVAGGAANAQIRGNEILMDKHTKMDVVSYVLGHEFTHRLQDLAEGEYMAFREALDQETLRYAAEDIQAIYQKEGREIDLEAAMDEAAANMAGKMLEDGALLDEFIERNRENKTLLERMRDVIRAIWSKLTGAERRRAKTAEGKLTAALDAAAKNAKQGKTGGESETRYQIKTLPDGRKYVQADRQVIFGNDPESWSQQLEDYINRKIRRGEDVQLVAADGDILTLTADTAGKVSSQFRGDGKRLPYEEFDRKVSAGAHIDELAQVSRSQGKGKRDVGGRHGDFASQGWDYRDAYFRDFDRKYYQVTISAAVNDEGKIVYNIGKMRKRDFPNHTGSSAKGGAQGVGKVSPSSKVSQQNGDVKPSYSLKGTERVEDAAELRRENEELQEKYEYWKKQTRRSQAGKVSEEVMLRRTRGLLRDYGVTEATMDSRTVAHKLQAVYDDIGSGVDSTTGGEMTFRAAKERVRHYNRAAVEKALERMKTQGK